VAKRQLYNLGEIARRFGGDLIGDAATRISQVASLESATAFDISFVSHPRFLSELAKTKAGAVIVGAHDRDATALPRIICANPYAYFARVSALLNPPAAVEAGVHKTAVVERGAKIADSASIGAGAYIGKKANIGPGASIGAGTFIGIMPASSLPSISRTSRKAASIVRTALLSSWSQLPQNCSIEGTWRVLRISRWIPVQDRPRAATDPFL